MSSVTFLDDQTLTLILAGGEGERLYPLTADQPKPVVSFGGVFRIIDFTLSNLRNSGLRRICLLTQYKHERLHSYVRDGWPRLSSEFRREFGEDMMCLSPSAGKRYRGTADAVFQNLDTIEQSSAQYVLIVSGDLVYHMDYGKLLHRHHISGADLTMAAVEYPVKLASSHAVIEADSNGRIIHIEERPESPCPLQSNPEQALVNMGVYVFSKKALIEALRKNADLSDSRDFVKDIVPAFVRSGRAGAFQFGGYWRDLSSLDLYYEANLDLLLAGTAMDPYENPAWPTHTLNGPKSLQRSWLDTESRVATDATLTACDVWLSIVSSGARIDEDAELEGAIVLPGAHIGHGAKIRNAIVAENTVVPPHARIGYDDAADRSQFPVSKNGIVIVKASEPGHQRARGRTIAFREGRKPLKRLSPAPTADRAVLKAFVQRQRLR